MEKGMHYSLCILCLISEIVEYAWPSFQKGGDEFEVWCFSKHEGIKRMVANR